MTPTEKQHTEKEEAAAAAARRNSNARCDRDEIFPFDNFASSDGSQLPRHNIKTDAERDWLERCDPHT